MKLKILMILYYFKEKLIMDFQMVMEQLKIKITNFLDILKMELNKVKET